MPLHDAPRSSSCASPAESGSFPAWSWQPPPDLQPCARLGRYEVLGRLAKGGMAEVLLARERTFDGGYRHVVLKRVIPEVEEDDYYKRMFLGEGRVMMRLQHPSICYVYDVGHERGVWYIAMEWVHGVALHEVIARAITRGRALPPAWVAHIVAHVAAALHHAHGVRDDVGRLMGLVHRDITPQNIMVGFNGAVKLLDFGIAKLTHGSPDHTLTGVVKGKHAYMAPEQCRGHSLDPRTDVFALGVCLYEALTGMRLFRRDTTYDTLRAVVSEPTPSIQVARPDLPASLDAIVQRATRKKPGARYPDAQALQMALEAYLSEGAHVVTASQVGLLMRELFPDTALYGPAMQVLRKEDRVRLCGSEHETVSGRATENRAARLERHRVSSDGWKRMGSLGAALLCGVGLASWSPWGSGTSDPAEVGVQRTEVSTSGLPAVIGGPGVPIGDALTTKGGASEAPGEPPEARSTELSAAEEAKAPSKPPVETRDRRAGRQVTRAMGKLSINTQPWSRVYIEGRLLGTTPLGELPVRAGKRRLRFEDRDGRTHRRVIAIPADGHVSQAFVFDE